MENDFAEPGCGSDSLIDKRQNFWDSMCRVFIGRGELGRSLGYGDLDIVFSFLPNEFDEYSNFQMSNGRIFHKCGIELSSDEDREKVHELADIVKEYHSQKLPEHSKNFAYQYFADKLLPLIDPNAFSRFVKRCQRGFDIEAFNFVTYAQIKSLLLETSEKYKDFGKDMLFYIGGKIQNTNFKSQIEQFAYGANVRNDNNSGCLGCLGKCIKNIFCCNNDER